MVKYKIAPLKVIKEIMSKWNDVKIIDEIVFASPSRPKVRELFLYYNIRPGAKMALKISPTSLETIKKDLKIVVNTKKSNGYGGYTYILK